MRQSQQEISMVAYIEQLKAAVAAERANNNQKRRENLRAARERLRPLDERLTAVLRDIPAELQAEGLSLAALQERLRGRWRGNCHPGELGAALRRLGFTRERRWRDGEGFRAVWRKRG
jgi:hypothetical protein